MKASEVAEHYDTYAAVRCGTSGQEASQVTWRQMFMHLTHASGMLPCWLPPGTHLWMCQRTMWQPSPSSLQRSWQPVQRPRWHPQPGPTSSPAPGRSEFMAVQERAGQYLCQGAAHSLKVGKLTCKHVLHTVHATCIQQACLLNGPTLLRCLAGRGSKPNHPSSHSLHTCQALSPAFPHKAPMPVRHLSGPRTSVRPRGPPQATARLLKQACRLSHPQPPRPLLARL